MGDSTKMAQKFQIVLHASAKDMADIVTMYGVLVKEVTPVFNGEPGVKVARHADKRRIQFSANTLMVMTGKTPHGLSRVFNSAHQIASKYMAGKKSVKRIDLTNAVKAGFKQEGLAETSASSTVSKLAADGYFRAAP